MHSSSNLLKRRRVRVPLLAVAVLTFGLLLSACGVTDEAGTKFNIVLESYTGDENSLVPIGIFLVDEMATVRFEVTRRDVAPVDRTSQAVFRVVNRSTGDRASDWIPVWSSDPSTVPHTIRSSVPDINGTICATYDGVEVLTDEPVEVCMRLATWVPEDYD